MGRQLSLNFLLFPGVILHEFSHYLACVLVGVKVKETKFWGREEAFVCHDQPGAWQSVVITIAPFLLGNILAWGMLSMANELLDSLSLLSLVYFWLSVSLIYFSFPSRHDAKNSFDIFISFYKAKILEEGPITSRIFWLISFPALFVPLVVLLGLILLFDSSAALRWIFVAMVLLTGLEPAMAYYFADLANYLLGSIARFFI